MKILIIHHLEPCWDYGYKRYGTQFQDLERRACSWIRKNKPDKIILTRFESHSCDFSEYESLPKYVNEVQVYEYGWDYEIAKELRKNGEKMVKGGFHSEYVWVPKWIINLKGNLVKAFGAFRGECLEDLEIALKAARVPHKFVESMCVG
jgi:hypothetical protein